MRSSLLLCTAGAHGAALLLLWRRRSGKPVDNSSLCIENKLLPEVYVLGAQKSATTSLARDLHAAGLEHSCGRKECFYFCDRASVPQAFDIVSGGQRLEWLALLPTCPTSSSVGRTVSFDASPSYLESFWVPSLLRNFYGREESRRLTLITLLREPLDRMRSIWRAAVQVGFSYHCRDCRAATFSDALNSTLRRARNPPHDIDDWLSHSLYARSMGRWLSLFDAGTFVVVPFRYYAHLDRGSLCHQLQRRLRLPLVPCESIRRRGKALNVGALQEDPRAEPAPAVLRSQFYASFPAAEVAEVLGTAHNRGSWLANYTGEGDVQSVQAWLERLW